MFRVRNVGLLALSFILGYAFFYLLGGHVIAAIFAVLWFDKVIIGLSGIVHKFGIEFTTIATILMGIIYGPIIAFVMSIIILPMLYGIRYILLPIAPPEWPLFVPSPQNLVEALGAAAAGLLAGFPLLNIFIAVFIIKEIAYIVTDRIIGKPPDLIYPVVNFIFNLLIIINLGGFFLGLVDL
jgi:hypothetical protein